MKDKRYTLAVLILRPKTRDMNDIVDFLTPLPIQRLRRELLLKSLVRKTESELFFEFQQPVRLALS